MYRYLNNFLKRLNNYANFTKMCWSSQAQILLVKKDEISHQCRYEGFPKAASSHMNGFREHVHVATSDFRTPFHDSIGAATG
jgi:hypothetical protein